jgi:hypothetical protein
MSILGVRDGARFHTCACRLCWPETKPLYRLRTLHKEPTAAAKKKRGLSLGLPLWHPRADGAQEPKSGCTGWRAFAMGGPVAGRPRWSRTFLTEERAGRRASSAATEAVAAQQIDAEDLTASVALVVVFGDLRRAILANACLGARGPNRASSWIESGRPGGGSSSGTKCRA